MTMTLTRGLAMTLIASATWTAMAQAQQATPTVAGCAGVDRYWVNDGGNWSDRSHWSCTSGGSGGASVPTESERCRFDSNSFTRASQIVDASSTAVIACLDMDWTGVSHTPTFTMAATTKVAGNLVLAAAMTVLPVGRDSFGFTMTGTGTVTSAGQQVGLIVDGHTTLADDLISHGDITVRGEGNRVLVREAATFSTGGHTLWIENLITSGVGGVLIWPSGTVKIADNIVTNACTLDAGNSLLEIIPEVDWSGFTVCNGSLLNDVHWRHSGLPYPCPVDIAVGSSFTVRGTFTIDPGTRIGTQGPYTVTADSIVCTGTAGKLITTGVDCAQTQGACGPSSTFTFNAKQRVVCDYVALHDTICTGILPCVAGAHSVDNGGNVGWCFGDGSTCPTYTPTPGATPPPLT